MPSAGEEPCLGRLQVLASAPGVGNACKQQERSYGLGVDMKSVNHFIKMPYVAMTAVAEHRLLPVGEIILDNMGDMV